MRYKTKVCFECIMAFLVLSLAIVPLATAAGAIILTPSSVQGQGSSVSVTGTGFGATKAVGILFGPEWAGNDRNMAYSGTGMGPYSGRVSNYPIKPGSFVLISDTTSGQGLVSTYTDNGDGTTTGSFEGAVGTINYVTGVWTRMTTVDVTNIATNYSATYTYYEFNVTPEAGITTTVSGGFAASITVPPVSAGDYTVTALDTAGNKATATLTVGSVIPESLTIGAVVALSSIAIIASSFVLKRSKNKNLGYLKL